MQPYLEISTNITLKPHSLQIHKQFTKRKYDVKEKSKANLDRKGKQYNGYMSDATSRQVKKMIENWLVSIEIKQGGKIKYQGRTSVYPTFVTLTLPFKQLHSDNHLKRTLLEPMIQWLTSEKLSASGENLGWGVKCYLWRAETQKNGNLHFHIIVDRWIPMDRLQAKWNQILDKLKYVKAYQMKMKFIYKNGFVIRETQLATTLSGRKKQFKKSGISFNAKEERKKIIEQQKQSYANGTQSDWTNPPSIQIKKLGTIKSISAYVTKYVCKKPLCLNPPKENQTIIDGYIYDVLPGVEGSERLQNEAKYVPIYEARTVQGRIWGRSDHLFNENPEALKVCAETVFVEFDRDAPHGKKWSRAEFTYDTEILDYTKKLGTKIGQEEIEKLNAKIDSDFIYIIPLMDKQIDYLQELSPGLKTRYISHYINLYDRLYPIAA
jgi:hypothetical protein